jgi:acetyl-CoA carboxylase biotin carboxyl carrier protein
MEFSIDHIRALAELANSQQLAEVTITDGDKSVTIKTPAATVPPVSAMYAPAYTPTPYAPVASSLPPEAVVSSGVEASKQGTSANSKPASHQTVTSPMVGTFYSAASPETPAFVSVGQSVKVGDTLCILEAMKQMNHFDAELAGVVVEVLAKNGQPVEYGQGLFVIDTAG